MGGIGSDISPWMSRSSGTGRAEIASRPLTDTKATMENVSAETVSTVRTVREGRFFKFDTPSERAVESESPRLTLSPSTSPPAARARRSSTSNRW